MVRARPCMFPDTPSWQPLLSPPEAPLTAAAALHSTRARGSCAPGAPAPNPPAQCSRPLPPEQRAMHDLAAGGRSDGSNDPGSLAPSLATDERARAEIDRMQQQVGPQTLSSVPCAAPAATSAVPSHEPPHVEALCRGWLQGAGAALATAVTACPGLPEARPAPSLAGRAPLCHCTAPCAPPQPRVEPLAPWPAVPLYAGLHLSTPAAATCRARRWRRGCVPARRRRRRRRSRPATSRRASASSPPRTSTIRGATTTSSSASCCRSAHRLGSAEELFHMMIVRSLPRHRPPPHLWCNKWGSLGIGCLSTCDRGVSRWCFPILNDGHGA